MKAIIPAKDNSARIAHKNFKNFYNGQSLVDLTIQKLLEVMDAQDIYLSCENKQKEKICSRWGVNFLHRDNHLTKNSVSSKNLLNGIVDQVPGDDDIAWCCVIEPFFNSYGECIKKWNDVNSEHDSLSVVYPKKRFILDSNYSPQGFGFGPWHKVSQLLPVCYELSFSLAILKRSCIRDIGYYLGANPYWYHAKGIHIDIDTNEDFELAQCVYRHYSKTN
tara:strand:+ start:5677 stop:6336 length:660 start_codon:yes stop_codon:yes gene_type:complete